MTNQIDINALKAIYEQYGFIYEKIYEEDQVIVFSIQNGYFNNADIVKLSPNSNTSEPFKEFSDIGFAPTIRQYNSTKEVELELFKGFFSVDTITSRLKQDYMRFTEGIIKPYSEEATYTYINAPYLIDGELGEKTPHEEIVSRLKDETPTLFLVEAAAGFGKTCNAYELVKNIIENTSSLPLFSELSRNREARIFKHILLYEIDRTFPGLRSQLVQSQITEGRVITILDGFDELLRNSEADGEIENKEPMLETIGEFLTGNAKIVLTTRRTVLFEGDAFHDWVDMNSENFKLVTIKINEPQIPNWLSEDRIALIESLGLKVENMSNPVLLSYLRCISDTEFDAVVSNPDTLVDSYFTFLMERERKRQDLRMQIEKQEELLVTIAKDMYECGYTSENRDYIVDFILDNEPKLIEETLKQYSGSEKPTKEEIANKLASHALLDRSTREPNKIGFINEFVLGHFIGKNILKSDEWLHDDYRFIEPAVLSYQPRSEPVKKSLWEALKLVNDFLPINNRVEIAIKLRNSINFELKNDEVNGLNIESVELGQKKIENFQFNNCTIRNCNFNPLNFNNVTFLNCKFYDNNLLSHNLNSTVHVLGGAGDERFILELNKKPVDTQSKSNEDADKALAIEKFILEKFWPMGREHVSYKHRPLTLLCREVAGTKVSELYAGVESLKKKNILVAPRNTHFLEVNFDSLGKIKIILNRD